VSKYVEQTVFFQLMGFSNGCTPDNFDICYLVFLVRQNVINYGKDLFRHFFLIIKQPKLSIKTEDGSGTEVH